jgi:hypothetical protein
MRQYTELAPGCDKVRRLRDLSSKTIDGAAVSRFEDVKAAAAAFFSRRAYLK